MRVLRTTFLLVMLTLFLMMVALGLLIWTHRRSATRDLPLGAAAA